MWQQSEARWQRKSLPQGIRSCVENLVCEDGGVQAVGSGGRAPAAAAPAAAAVANASALSGARRNP